MNAIDIAILFILAASIIYGCYRGFLHTILSMACCILAFLVAVIFGPSLASSVSSNESIQSTLVNYTDALTRVDDTSLANQQIAGQMDEGVISRILENVNLPDPIKNILENNLKGQVFSNTSVSTVNGYVSNTVVFVAIQVLSFIVCFIVSYLVLSIVLSLVQHVFKLPLLRQADWLAGGIFGLLRGALVIYVLFLLLPVLKTVVPLDSFTDMVDQSALAPIFQSNGFFSGVISGII